MCLKDGYILLFAETDWTLAVYILFKAMLRHFPGMSEDIEELPQSVCSVRYKFSEHV